MEVAKSSRARPYKRALFLPGEDMLCVREALNAGVINRGTQCVFVERDRKVMDKIRSKERYYLDFINPPYYIESELKDVAINSVVKEPLDFAYLDLCGYIGEDEAAWVAEDLNLEPEAFLGFTTYNIFRTYKLGSTITKQRKTTPDSVLSSLIDCKAHWFAEIDKSENRAKARVNSLVTTNVIDLSLWAYNYKLLDSVQYRESGTSSTMLSTLLQIKGRQGDERRAREFYKAIGRKGPTI